MNPSDDQKLELLYNHYCDTYAVIQQLIKSRDRFFISILVLLGVMSFQIALPTESGSVIAEFARARLGIRSTLSVSFLGSVIWAALLFVVVRYFQITVYLERQYRYIHALEAELSPFYSGVPFTREGTFYLADYPWFSAWVARLYTWVFPAGLIFAATLKILSEARLPRASTLPLWTDAVLYVLMVVATVLYLIHIALNK
jgi:hypothetical protein